MEPAVLSIGVAWLIPKRLATSGLDILSEIHSRILARSTVLTFILGGMVVGASNTSPNVEPRHYAGWQQIQEGLMGCVHQSEFK